MTRTGEEVKAKYKKQWTRAPARVSLYKTPCPPDLPPFRGCWRQPAAAVFIPAVCRSMCGFAGIAPTLSPGGSSAQLHATKVDSTKESVREVRRVAGGTVSCSFRSRKPALGGYEGRLSEEADNRRLRTNTRSAQSLPTQASGCRRSDTLAEDEQSDVPQVGEHRFVEGISSQRVRRAHIDFTKERACCHRRQRHHLPKWG